MSALLETKRLKKYFSTPRGMLHAVDDVDLSIERGATLGVVGESGCGKSTLGRTVIRLLDATAGEVLFDGRDVMKMDKSELRQFRNQAQIIFQDPYASLNPRLTVSEIIAEPLIAGHVMRHPADIEKKVFKMMDTVGLAARLVNTYPHELDGGRRQRIGIARSLVLDPQFIVCDEPVSALDVSIQAQILNLLMDLQREKKLTYMFITHDLSVVKHISTEIAVMYLGKCVEHGPAKAIFANPLHPYTKALLSAIPIPDLSQRGKKRELLTGEVSSPINPKPGCRFASRCPYASQACTQQDIQLQDFGGGHYAACCALNASDQ
ncbi:MAG: ATP-binding cassette domain-containing protein [Clostridia bacterium]|nr:ATP-binding cassette domain-containing protein [Clostridia bacterium]